MKLYKIYKYTNLIVGMSYVGQTCQSLEERAGRDMTGYRGCDEFWKAIQHYGTDCWRDEILWEGLTLDEANIYEELEIRDNETLFPYGYNLKEGGEGGTYSDEARRKISEAQKGRKLSEEHRRNISEGTKGRVVTDQTKRKISEAHTGRKHSAEACENMSKAQKSNPSRGMLNKKHSQKARRKMSEARKGVTPWMKGKKHPESTREKIREARKHQIMKPVSADTREKLRKASTGRIHSKETLQKMSDAAKGRTAWNRSAVWDNAEEIIRLYTVEKLTCNAIATMYGVSSTPIQNILRSNGIKLSKSRKPTRCDIWSRQSEVVSLYTQEFKSTKEIADMFEVSTPTVLKVLRSNKVELISTRKVAAWRHQDEIIDLYTVEMKNINEIATMFKTCSDVVSRILKSNSVPRRKIENQNHPYYGKPAHNRSDMWNHVDEVIKLYTMEFKTSREIGEIFGVNGSVVLKLLKANGVDTSPKRHTIYDHVKEVVRFYTVDMKTMREIADIFGTERHLVSKLLKANGVEIDKPRKSRPWKHHPERGDVQNIFTTLPLEMSLPEKRSFLYANFPNINKSTLNKWIREWSNVTGCQPRHAHYSDVNDFFLSLRSDMPLKEKRRITRKQFPDVKDFTINRWTRKWQSELETHNYVQPEFRF